ncbi:AGZA family xanthine/uracil permease-like MFS transporter [Methanomicrobium sp. W14]|uniref:NCS2 family permease n=1 Tax=Methanomicrobium sp. W14 TaxID=2817839 RepID=UPI001AE9A75A|nr:NCS2 family permease [Methanomicrobium sp. W14]MBP2132634.1 AGZA family xanthine/uracil permease-like MFS transporter [Methanomicrobium sp. W14]
MHFSERLFKLKDHKTDVKTEVNAGIVTFMTMAYIVIVNPAILVAAGIPIGPSMVATIITAVFGTLIMGIYANRPFAIAPYMGENAFIAYTVCGVLGYSWQTALGAVFISGILLALLTIAGGRKVMCEAIPTNLKYSFSVGIGLFIAFIGLVNSKIVALGTESAPLHLGDLGSPEVILAIFGFLLISTLTVRKIKGAILVGILATSLIGFISGIAAVPEAIVSVPPDITPVLFQLDIAGALTWGFFAVILTIFTMSFLDTMAGLIGISAQAGFLDEKGNLPEVEKPFLSDAVANIIAPLVGTTTSGAFAESATGIRAGGRTGLTAVVVAVLFALCLFFSPVLTSIPSAATGPAMIMVGLLMTQPIKKMNFSDYSEMIPAIAVIVLMSFTYNIGVGLCSGFVLYPLFKTVGGKWKEISRPTWFLFALCLLFFIFYPY